jgi:hypothetical protein
MTNTTTPATATPVTKSSKARRTRAGEADIARAIIVLAALPSLLPGIAAKDKGAAKVRIDKAWVTQYANVLAAAQTAEGQRNVATVEQKAATADEKQKGLQLSLILTDVRDLVATHNPDDLAAQQAYGRGEQIDPRRIHALATIAGAYLAAWDGKWKTPAVDAGVTQATMSQIQSLRDALAASYAGQHQVIATSEEGTSDRVATLAGLRQLTAFAVKVVTNVFGRGSSQLRSLSDPRPLTSRASAFKAKTKAKHAAVKAATKAKKKAVAAKPGARAKALKRRAARVVRAAKTKAVVAKAKPAAKVRKSAKKKAKAK